MVLHNCERILLETCAFKLIKTQVMTQPILKTPMTHPYHTPVNTKQKKV